MIQLGSALDFALRRTVLDQTDQGWNRVES